MGRQSTRMIVTLFLLWGVIESMCQDTITLKAIVRDFTPSTNIDFQRLIKDDVGLLQNELDVDGKPQLKEDHPDGPSTTITNQALFSQWYRKVPDINIEFEVDITLTRSNGVYTFNSASFFPIDGLGFGNYPGYSHNYHFTTELHNTFTYLGNETFTFSGDDDTWVFINNKLVVDIGGVHPVRTATISLQDIADDIGLVVGNSYRMDFFHAERHTTESNFRIDTTLELIPIIPDPIDENGIRASICEVSFDICIGNADNCPSDPLFTLLGTEYHASNFNAISFGSFHATTGDVEGRLAVKNDYEAGAGYSIGFELRTAGSYKLDDSLPFSLLVGRNGSWISGSLHPSESDPIYIGPQEDMFIGKTFTGPAYLVDRNRGPCATNGCYDNEFEKVREYYIEVSESLSSITPNANAVLEYSTLKLTCDSSSSTSIVVNIDVTLFNSLTSWELVNCKEEAQYIINILGDSIVYFRGASFPRKPERVVYNVLGSSRVIDVTETAVHGSILSPRNTLHQTGGVIIGLVIVGDISKAWQINRLTCEPQPTIPKPKICPSFEKKCIGYALPLKGGVYSFRDFNVVAFGDFSANTGDTEGRLIVAGNLTLGAGYSVGYELMTLNGPDSSLPYSVVVGGNAYWESGEVYPLGTGNPFPGDREDIFVGGEWATGEFSQYLYDRRTGGPCKTKICLSLYFKLAKACYILNQLALSAKQTNAVATSKYNGILIECANPMDTEYVVSISANLLSSSTYYILSGCNLAAEWVINVPSSNDEVLFTGDHFPGNPRGIVYNILGSGRTIRVQTQVNGNILSPNNDIVQTGGVIVGKVVIRNYLATEASQINRIYCPTIDPIKITTLTTGPMEKGSNKVGVLTASNFKAGDKCIVGSEEFELNKIFETENAFVFQFDHNSEHDHPYNEKITTIVDNPAKFINQNIEKNNEQESSSSSLYVSMVIILSSSLLAVLLF